MPTTSSLTTRRERTRRARLDRDTVVDAALDFIDEHGAHALTMRDLGRRLDVEAMSLYRYVAGREDLLEAVVAHLMAGLEDRTSQDPAETWQDYLQTVSREVRRLAMDHPRAFPLVATRHPAAPWLRPPLRSLGLVEQLLSTLEGHRFDDEQAAHVYRAFSSFLLGHLLLESTVRGAPTAPVGVPISEESEPGTSGTDQDEDLSDFPHLLRLRPRLTEDHSEEEFEVALAALLERLEATLDH